MSQNQQTHHENIELGPLPLLPAMRVSLPVAGKPAKENQPMLTNNITHKPFKLLSPPPRDSSLLARYPRPRDVTPVSPAKTPPESPIKATPSNIGKRRSYAPALLSSPARPSHSSRMMKIFQDARLSLKTKDRTSPTEIRMHPFDTSSRNQAVGEQGYFDPTCASLTSNDPFLPDRITKQAGSKVMYPQLPPPPESPIRADNPWHVALPHSHAHLHRSAIAQGHNHNHASLPPLHIPDSSNPTFMHDSAIGIQPHTPSSPSWSGDDEFYVPSTIPALPPPPPIALPATDDPWVNAWLDGVPVGQSPTTEQASHDAEGYAAATHHSPQRHRRSRFHPTRISEINGEGDDSDADADNESEGEPTQQRSVVHQLIVAAPAAPGDDDDENQHVPLSPDVEIKRGRTKERTPNRVRCASYYDEDIVPSPRVRGKRAGRGGRGWF